MLNRVILMGRITHDLEVRQTASGHYRRPVSGKYPLEGRTLTPGTAGYHRRADFAAHDLRLYRQPDYPGRYSRQTGASCLPVLAADADSHSRPYGKTELTGPENTQRVFHAAQ